MLNDLIYLDLCVGLISSIHKVKCFDFRLSDDSVCGFSEVWDFK